VIMTSITVMRRWNAQAEILPSSTTRFFYWVLCIPDFEKSISRPKYKAYTIELFRDVISKPNWDNVDWRSTENGPKQLETIQNERYENIVVYKTCFIRFTVSVRKSDASVTSRTHLKTVDLKIRLGTCFQVQDEVLTVSGIQMWLGKNRDGLRQTK
jgi:hypothetical protein